MIKFFFIILFIVIVSYMVYHKTNSTFVPNDEFIKEEKFKTKAEVYLFYADWCPHSIDALKTWNQLSELYKDSETYNLKFIKVNVDEDPTLADSYNIDSYPSVVLVYKNEHYTYDALLEESTFKTFLKTFIK